MATRRARIKLAPNLGLSRKKTRQPVLVPVKAKIVITSDTSDHSDSELGTETSDLENAAVTTNETILMEKSLETTNNVNGLIVNGSNGCAKAAVEITSMDIGDSNSKETNDGGVLDIPTETGVEQPDSNCKEILTGDVIDISTESEAASLPRAKLRLPMMRSKFRPNLNIERGQRTVGRQPGLLLPGSRCRTVSSSSTNSESDSSLRPAPDSPILRSAILSPKPARVRRTTESSRSTLGERTQFHNRRQVHKAKFSKGVPDRTNLTMFDLIYYNPQHGQRMSVDDEEDIEKIDDPDDPTCEPQPQPEKAEKMEKPEPLAKVEEGRTDALPVPRVKVGVNGEIILDEASLHVETTQQKEAKVILKAAPLVFENNKTSFTYGRWSKKRRHKDWTEKETLKFYKALSVVGSDFSMMESIFSNRTRSELRLKFKKEEKINGKMVDKCLNEKRMFTDLDSLMNASEDEVEEVEADSSRRSRSKKGRTGRPRRRYKNRGLYDSSSGSGGEGDIETSKSPVSKKLRTGSGDFSGSLVQRVKRPLVTNGDHDEPSALRKAPVQEVEEVVGGDGVANGVADGGADGAGDVGVGVSLSNLSGVQFPPGLLAANPSLVGAKPGSLVVVAGPQKPQHTRSPLHLYMVQVKEKKSQEGSVMTARTVSSTSPELLTELRLDPAVIRAVDRGKLHRQRTLSECDGRRDSEPETGQQGTVRARQRTHSESSARGLSPVSPSTGEPAQPARTRFLSENDGSSGASTGEFTRDVS